jgi:hypothetical protein
MVFVRGADSLDHAADAKIAGFAQNAVGGSDDEIDGWPREGIVAQADAIEFSKQEALHGVGTEAFDDHRMRDTALDVLVDAEVEIGQQVGRPMRTRLRFLEKSLNKSRSSWRLVCRTEFWSHLLPNSGSTNFGVAWGVLPNCRENWRSRLRRGRCEAHASRIGMPGDSIGAAKRRRRHWIGRSVVRFDHGVAAGRSGLLSLLELIVVEPAFEDEDGGAEVVVERHQEVDVVEVLRIRSVNASCVGW